MRSRYEKSEAQAEKHTIQLIELYLHKKFKAMIIWQNIPLGFKQCVTTVP